MAGVLNVVYAEASPRHNGRVYRAIFGAAENIATSGTSATTTGSAVAGGVVRVTSVTGAHYIGKPSTTAVNAAGWYLPEGASIDLAGFNAGEKITAVEAS